MIDLVFKKIHRRLRNFTRIQLNKKNLDRVLNERSRKITGISFEVTNRCNANCSFCAYRYMSRPKMVMDLSLYKEALSNCVREGIEECALSTIVGDPLEDPFLLERIKFARAKPEIKRITFYTNLIGVERFDIKEFLLSGITDIAISTSFKNAEFYKRYFGVNKYDKVIDNIKRLCNTNMSLGKPLNIEIFLKMPISSLCGIGTNRLYREIATMVNNIYINYYYDDWYALIKKNDIPHGCRFISLKNKRRPCKNLYGSDLMVMLDGRVTICGCRNFDANDELIIGDIKKTTLRDIWLGEKIKRMRREWLNGKIPKICEKCRSYDTTYLYLV